MNRLINFSKVVIFALLTIMTIGCSQEEDWSVNDSSQPQNVAVSSDKDLMLTDMEQVALSVKKKGSYKIEEKEARNNLESYMRITHGKKVGKIKNVSLKKNKKNGKDLYYEILFENDKGTGFSWVSADERVDKVLCYLENGSVSDTSFNKSLKYCLELVDHYAKKQTQEELDIEALSLSANRKIQEANTDRVMTKALPPFDPNDPKSPWTYDRTEWKEEVSDRIKLVPGGWHQGYPFNNLLPLLPPDYVQRAYVGCVMIAVSQIMAYHKKPYSNYITAAMWPGMINNVTTSVELQRLMLDLFNAMQTSFDKEGTSSNISKARGFLNNNGYTAGSESGYSFDKVWNALNYGPTYVQGTNPLINKGHAWVADGARQTKITTYDVYTTIYKGKVYEIQGSAYMSTSLEVRYDWGWKHGNNTWFASGVFAQDPNSLNYNKDVKIISYIY